MQPVYQCLVETESILESSMRGRPAVARLKFWPIERLVQGAQHVLHDGAKGNGLDEHVGLGVDMGWLFEVPGLSDVFVVEV